MRRLRVLAVVGRFKTTHIDYLHALATEVDLSIAWSGVGRRGAPEIAQGEGLPMVHLGEMTVAPEAVRARLAEVIAKVRPDVIHVMYYRHEQLALWARELASDRTRLVLEVRDPLTTLDGAVPGSAPWRLEGSAVRAADGVIGVSSALVEYLERAHRVELSERSMVVPHAFARRNAGVPQPKLSATDGRTHIALVGTANPNPQHDRCYLGIIRSLVEQGLVVHSRFHRIEGVDLSPYEELARELPGRYHFEDKLPYREGTLLSEAVSRYDLMGVFHQLDAALNNESATLAICLPTKSVSGWFHGAIPAVCYPHYRGVVERIDQHGIGFVVDRLEDVAGVAVDRAAIERATTATLAVRDEFSHEFQAARIADFYARLRSATSSAQTS